MTGACAFSKLCFRFRKNLYKSIWKYNVHRQTQGFTSGEKEEGWGAESELRNVKVYNLDLQILNFPQFLFPSLCVFGTHILLGFFDSLLSDSSFGLLVLILFQPCLISSSLCVISWCWVTKSRPTLCDPMDCSTPGFPVLHYLPEFAQTHVHWVGDGIWPSHPL